MTKHEKKNKFLEDINKKLIIDIKKAQVVWFQIEKIKFAMQLYPVEQIKNQLMNFAKIQIILV